MLSAPFQASEIANLALQDRDPQALTSIHLPFLLPQYLAKTNSGTGGSYCQSLLAEPIRRLIQSSLPDLILSSFHTTSSPSGQTLSLGHGALLVKRLPYQRPMSEEAVHQL